jgi:hypothetical protein
MGYCQQVIFLQVPQRFGKLLSICTSGGYSEHCSTKLIREEVEGGI